MTVTRSVDSRHQRGAHPSPEFASVLVLLQDDDRGCKENGQTICKTIPPDLFSCSLHQAEFHMQ
jgi:hypothetical protein